MSTAQVADDMPSANSRICPCGKQRYFCKPCGGKGICPCGNVRRRCRECTGNEFCPHPGCTRRKAHCLAHSGDNEPSGVCGCAQEGRIRARCARCGGSQLCECGIRRASCAIHGKQCACGRLAYTCPEHGSRFCPCGKRKELCVKHGGSSICPCGKQRTLCAQHGGGSLCPCGKRRDRCPVHGLGGAENTVPPPQPPAMQGERERARLDEGRVQSDTLPPPRPAHIQESRKRTSDWATVYRERTKARRIASCVACPQEGGESENTQECGGESATPQQKTLDLGLAFLQGVQ